MAEEARARHGRGLDLAILSEAAVTGEVGGDALGRSVPFAGPLGEAFARKAREHRCYIVVPTYLREAGEPARCSNAAVLVDRGGRVAGVYRKMHLVVGGDRKTLEGGSTPGTSVPVFDCDFGKLGIQICYDMEFDRGWEGLARDGAEIVAWPTQSPQTAHPAARAMAHHFYIVSSTWRHNASVFEPTGKIAAQILPPAEVLVHELDLSYAILPWSSKLKKGQALKELFGDRIGYRYYEDEDCGIFWSNDPKMPVARMISTLGVEEAELELARVRETYRRAGVPGY
jgi:predicted amidohydrolase